MFVSRVKQKYSIFCPLCNTDLSLNRINETCLWEVHGVCLWDSIPTCHFNTNVFMEIYYFDSKLTSTLSYFSCNPRRRNPQRTLYSNSLPLFPRRTFATKPLSKQKASCATTGKTPFFSYSVTKPLIKQKPSCATSGKNLFFSQSEIFRSDANRRSPRSLLGPIFPL